MPVAVRAMPIIDGIKAVISVRTRNDRYKINTIIMLHGYKNALYGLFLLGSFLRRMYIEPKVNRLNMVLVAEKKSIIVS